MCHNLLRQSTYCDNFSLLTSAEELHTRDVDSSSLYSKPDHLLRLASMHVLADRLATDTLADLYAADKPTDFYQLPAYRVYISDATGHLKSH